MEKRNVRVGILGGGPSALFLYKYLIELKVENLEISIFERKGMLGAGMPYSKEGALPEHVTNVSDNEIPDLVSHIDDWVRVAPKKLLNQYHINADNFNEYKVMPRLFFGEYLAQQFDYLIEKAAKSNIRTHIHTNCNIVDVIDHSDDETVDFLTEEGESFSFDYAMICSGHNWNKGHELNGNGYFTSPYPPNKLEGVFNHPIAIRGSSLTAIDAIRTLANHHGKFTELKSGRKIYTLHQDYPNFRLTMHSRNGLLPAVRFHLEDSHLSAKGLLTEEEIAKHREENGGFVSLDYLFNKNFKEIFSKEDPDFYQRIKNYNLEDFVEEMMREREKLDPFELLKAEYREAEQSIRNEESIYWKELLAILSFTLNHPAKYLSAEDTLRLQTTLMPLISVIIAFLPQSSCEVLMALHDAGILDLVEVGKDNKFIKEDRGGVTIEYLDENNRPIKTYYETFIDCIGQPHLNMEDFPFQSLVSNGTIGSAYVSFKNAEAAKELQIKDEKRVLQRVDGAYDLSVAGIAINDDFQILDADAQPNNRIFMLAVPYIGGFNPDYSGLDFSDAASAKVSAKVVQLIDKRNLNQ